MFLRRYGGSQEIKFRRHGDKAPKEDWMTDKDIYLTPEGFEKAKKAGEAQGIDPKAIAYRSPRNRTGETAAAFLRKDGVKCNNTVEQIREILKSKGTPNQIRDTYENNLDYYMCEDYDTWEKDKELGKQAMDACYKAAGTAGQYLDFVMNQSDDLLRKLKNPKISSYTKCAGDMAELILNYYNLEDRWAKHVRKNGLVFMFRVLASKLKKNNSNFGEAQRLFCTHAGVTEPFLLKVVEMYRGKDGVKKFIDKHKIADGFSKLDGFDISITKGVRKKRAVLKFKGEEFELTKEILESIIKNRDNLYKDIGVKKNADGKWIIDGEWEIKKKDDGSGKYERTKMAA